MVGLLDILGFGRGGMDENGTFRLQDPAMLGLLNQQAPQGAQMPFGILSGMAGNGPAMPLSQSFGLNGANMPSMQPQDLPAPGASPVSGPAMPPMPPQRPEGLGFNEPAQAQGFVPPMPPERPANLPAPSAAPAGPAPSAPASTPAKDEPGFLSKLGTLAGSIYGQGGPGDSLIALGAGLASGPNWGSGLMKGMAMVNANALTADKKALEREQARLKLLGLSGSVETLKKAFPGRSDAEYASWAQQPQIIQEALKRTEGAFTGPPQLVDVQQPDGSTSKQWLYPGQTTGSVVSTTPAPPGLPAGADPKKFREAQAAKAAEEAQTNRQKQEAGEFVMPYIDRAHAAYKRLGEIGAIGPISASGFNRTVGGTFGTEAEKLRQDYEAAAKQLELYKAQIQMKGQGQITEGERKILQLTLPRLDAADPKTGLQTLDMLRNDFLRAGRPAGQQPQQNRADPLGIR